MATTVPDRRQRRRLETIEEVLDVALEVMAEHGVGGLSIGEVARRMGIRPPSLYVYFASKNDIYDALFERGARQVLEAMRTATADLLEQDRSAEEILLVIGSTMVRWTVEHQSYAQLLFWRTVPGFTPSADAYAPAVELVADGQSRFAEMQQRGLFRDDVSVDDILRDWTVVTAGIATQQMANAPEQSFEQGRFTSALPGVVAMFARHYAPPATDKPTRRARDARKR